MVSGRLFPVEQRYRPFEESREYDLNNAICDAVDELWRDGPGDVLVFLPGEREIREAAEALRKHHPPGVGSCRLFSRLSEADQNKVFEPHGARRIVLATNVAETSLTVPGIPLRHRPGPGARQALQLPQQGRAVADRAHQPGRQQPARGPLRPGVQRHLHPALAARREFSERPRFTDPKSCAAASRA